MIISDKESLIILLLGFLIVAVAANQLSKLFKRLNLPVITGLLVVGIVSGPFILGLVPKAARYDLTFINDISLAFIAFAAAAELYLKDLRGRLKSIKWMTFGQLVVTFIFSSFAIYFLADNIGFMREMPTEGKIAISILMGTIFVARSPASAIAVINEMRAKGPFVQTAMGVTVVKDFLVIVLFAINFSVANVLIKGGELNLWFLLIVFLELLVSFTLGYALGNLLAFILSIKTKRNLKAFYILAIGFGIYQLYYFTKDYTSAEFGKEFLIEPLLICIVGSFFVTNYTKYRHEFINILEEIGPYVYVCFFTLTGATMSLDLLLKVWPMALVLFGIRLATMVVGSYVGGSLAGDPPLFNRIGWMPYVTQAGVGLDLLLLWPLPFRAGVFSLLRW